MDTRYNPQEIEGKITKMWHDGGYFQPNMKQQKPFAISMPPPNVTGRLHMGHALDQTMQDVLVRTKRMQGYATLWVPGTDHAGIATQVKVEENIRKTEGKSRHDLGREEFIKRVWEWKDQYGSEIMDQVKRLGSSCDLSKECFTMNEGYAKAIREVFVNLYNDKMIYQGSRIINWCCSCTTALSDIEVDYSEKEGHFWHIKYPIVGTDEHLVIATTRPETMLGDTAVAVNPDDERYKHLIGKMVMLPLMEREIPIIADSYADAELGTGCVKMTPAHDPNDFEVGLRHNLEVIRVFDDNGYINGHGGKFKGMERYEARKKIVEELEALGLLEKIEPHTHSIGSCSRCGMTVEPIVSKQWFVNMEPLAEEAIKVVKEEEINFVPERFSKTYLSWMENIRDWCISRQLWWGHRIPAFYCDECSAVEVSKVDLEACPHCGSKMRQDEDVLDTWFSSALWPFANLGWPEPNEYLNKFYPNSVLVTGYDIIFFWVARMIFSGLHHTDSIPFKDVLIHGIVRDSQGRKMSKSLGNGIDPLVIIDKFGADALRAQLISAVSPGNDMKFFEEKTEEMRNFANKLWNAARFVESTAKNENGEDTLQVEDKWILTLASNTIAEVTELGDKYELGIAFNKVYSFVWDELCDWYIEMVKPRIFAGEKVETLNKILAVALKLLHPFMPFVTEEIYNNLYGEVLCVAEYPTYNSEDVFENEFKQIEELKEGIRKIRNLRAEMEIPPSKKCKVYVEAKNSDIFKTSFFAKLAYADGVEFCKPSDGIAITLPSAIIYLDKSELVDEEVEKERIKKEALRLEKEIALFESKLSNKEFVAKAPEKVITEHKEKLAKYKEMYEKLMVNQ